jgi:hypothetical protein
MVRGCGPRELGRSARRILRQTRHGVGFRRVHGFYAC